MPIQKAAFKHLLLLICLTMSHGIFAKVAYIPMFEATAQQENHIWAIDLESGHVLKRVFVGDCVGPIFINSVGDQLYAAASLENKIVLIDTNSLEISQEWNNLAISPSQIILNTDETKLYFAERGQNDIYEIDLINNHVSVVLTINDFNSFHYSSNMEYIVFHSRDVVNDIYQLHTHHLSDLSFKYQATVPDEQPMLIDDDGESFYISLFGYGRFQSRSLENGTMNWEFYHSSGIPGPIGPMPEYFSSAFQTSNNQINVSNLQPGIYTLQAISNKGTSSLSRFIKN